MNTRTCKSGHTMTGIGFDEGCPECEEPWVTPTQPDWREELQFEIMENYIMTAELRHLAKDEGKYMEEMRKHWQKLQDFIQSVADTSYEDGLYQGRLEESVGCDKHCVEAVDTFRKRAVSVVQESIDAEKAHGFGSDSLERLRDTIQEL